MPRAKQPVVEHLLQQSEALARPLRSWRTATIVAVAVAAIELLLLVILVGALIGKPDSSGGSAPAAAKASAAKADAKKATAAKASAAKKQKAAPVAAPELKRTQVSVLVLNGNGRQGAAADTAQKVTGRGYKVGGVANAPSHEYASSMVMFRRGFAAEAQRLARDLGIKLVGPLDGIRAKDLRGAHAVLIVGS